MDLKMDGVIAFFGRVLQFQAFQEDYGSVIESSTVQRKMKPLV
jgi:hypothetical protein